MRYTLLTVPLLAAALTCAQLGNLPGCAVSSFILSLSSPTSSLTRPVQRRHKRHLGFRLRQHRRDVSLLQSPLQPFPPIRHPIRLQSCRSMPYVLSSGNATTLLRAIGITDRARPTEVVKFAQGICTGQTIPGADQCANGGSSSSGTASSSATPSSSATANSTTAAGVASSVSAAVSSSVTKSESSTTGGSVTSSATGSAAAGQTSAASGTAASASKAAAGRIEVGGLGLAVLGFGAALVV